MSEYPVQLEVSPPVHYDRLQLLVRFFLGLVLGWIGLSTGWIATLLYVGLPVFAAIIISSRGPDALLTRAGPKLWSVLEWLLAFSAYMLLVTDRFPAGRDPSVRVSLRLTARPRVESALVRLVTAIPSAVVLVVLQFVAWLLVLAGIVTVLLTRSVPAPIQAFQIGVVRWQARLLAYLASFVDEYPPFSFEHGDAPGAQATAV